jgi:hypothetical protein
MFRFWGSFAYIFADVSVKYSLFRVISFEAEQSLDALFTTVSCFLFNENLCAAQSLLFRYPAINKPAAILHWLNHVQTDAEFIIILDADMIMRGPITPWEFGAEKDLVVAAPYE